MIPQLAWPDAAPPDPRRLILLAVLLSISLLDGDEQASGPTPTPTAASPTSSSTSNDSPIEVTETSDRCRVTGPASFRALVQQLAHLCVPAARTVDRAWGAAWAEGGGRRTRLMIAGDIDGLAELLDREDTQGLADTAAVTVGPDGAPADAVFINGPAFDELSDLGREVVLAHELVHVASRATGNSAAPTWLEEGYADYVAYRDTDLLPDQIAAEALEAPLPRALPETEDFDAAGAEAAVAYGRSWAAAMLLAERLGGDAAMRKFYERAAHASLSEALKEAGFASEGEFVGAWRREIVELREVG